MSYMSVCRMSNVKKCSCKALMYLLCYMIEHFIFYDFMMYRRHGFYDLIFFSQSTIEYHSTNTRTSSITTRKPALPAHKPHTTPPTF